MRDWPPWTPAVVHPEESGMYLVTAGPPGETIQDVAYWNGEKWLGIPVDRVVAFMPRVLPAPYELAPPTNQEKPRASRRKAT